MGAPRAGRAAAGLDRDLTAWWIGAALLALPAVVSPLEVRYLYALTAPVAAAAGLGVDPPPSAGRGSPRARLGRSSPSRPRSGPANLAAAVFSQVPGVSAADEL